MLARVSMNPSANRSCDGAVKCISVAGYTRTEVDDKISALAKGMSHGEAVMSFLNAPPASPAQYQLHIVGTSPSGAFAGHANELAEWDGAAWVFSTARSGESHLLEDSGQTWHWNGTAWVKVGAVALPAGFDRVADIRAVKNGIELVSANGKRARTEVDLDWLGGS